MVYSIPYRGYRYFNRYLLQTSVNNKWNRYKQKITSEPCRAIYIFGLGSISKTGNLYHHFLTN